MLQLPENGNHVFRGLQTFFLNLRLRQFQERETSLGLCGLSETKITKGNCCRFPILSFHVLCHVLCFVMCHRSWVIRHEPCTLGHVACTKYNVSWDMCHVSCACAMCHVPCHDMLLISFYSVHYLYCLFNFTYAIYGEIDNNWHITGEILNIKAFKVDSNHSAR